MSAQQPISPWPDEKADPWRWPTPEDPRGGAPYARQLSALRAMLDQLAGAYLPDQIMDRLAEEFTRVSGTAARHQRGERFRFDGLRPDLPGRGHPLLPPYEMDEESAAILRGRIRFGRHYLGGNGAVHGGALPLLFDDVLGKMANHLQPGVARTAYLHVNYRLITPIDTELVFEVTLDRIEGRKRWVTGRLVDGEGRLLADAEGLFLELLSGQP